MPVVVDELTYLKDQPVADDLTGLILYGEKPPFNSAEAGGNTVQVPTSLFGSVDDPQLQAIAALTPAANQAIYFTDEGTAALFDTSTYGRSLAAAAAAAAARLLLELGSAALAEAADFATAAQGLLADSAVQPGDLAAVATSGDYGDLLNTPDLGDLALEDWPASDGQEYVAKNGAWAMATGGGTSLPVADSTAIVKGSVDATKLLRFEVDGFTTGTTRVLTPPDQDVTIAGKEVNNQFSASQTIEHGSDPYIGIVHTSGKFGGFLAGTGGATFQFDATGSLFIHAASTVNDAAVDANRNLTVTGSANAYSRFGFNNTSPACLWDGRQITSSNSTQSIMTIQEIRSTGVGTAGFGSISEYRATTTTTHSQPQARLTHSWATATHASRKARSVWSVYDTAEREAIRIEASGTAPMIGFLGASAIARQAHIVDADGTLADITTKFNTLLGYLESYGLIATS